MSAKASHGWQFKTLSEVVHLKHGRALSKEAVSETAKYPIYGSNGIIGRTSNFLFDKPTIVIGRVGASGEIKLTNGPAWFSDNSIYISDFLEDIDLRFLYYCLRWTQLSRFASRTSQPLITQSTILKHRVPLPPVQTQKLISNILVRAEELVNKRGQANQLTNKIIQSVFFKMFGNEATILKSWEWRTIEECTDRIIDYRGKTPPKTSSGVPLITAKIVKNDEILEPNEFIAADFYDKWMVRGLPRYGDVLFTSEAPLGNVAQLKLKKKIALAQRIILLRGKEKVVDNAFLVYALLHPIVKREIQSRATGSTVKGIRQARLREVRIPIPPLELQEKFARVSARIESMRQNQIQSTREISELFYSLMNKAFSGELIS